MLTRRENRRGIREDGVSARDLPERLGCTRHAQRASPRRGALACCRGECVPIRIANGSNPRPAGSQSTLWPEMENAPRGAFCISGGEGGIRTHVYLLDITGIPVQRLRPLGHLSGATEGAEGYTHRPGSASPPQSRRVRLRPASRRPATSRSRPRRGSSLRAARAAGGSLDR